MARKKARFFSVYELEHTNFNTMAFSNEWRDAFGEPQKSGTWIIYGESYNGKTSFTVKLVKYLTNFVKTKVLFNSLEEGKSESLKLNSKRTGLATVASKILLGDRVPMPELLERLRKQRSPEVIVIDSLQYTDLDKASYKAIKAEFPNKLFIFISHAEGKHPVGSVAKSVLFDSDVKIRVEGFTAYPRSRFGGGEPFVINAERAAAHHAKLKAQ